MSNFKTESLLQELNSEYIATRKCLENISETLFEYKPHPKSMSMGYLALLVTEIPFSQTINPSTFSGIKQPSGILNE